MAANHCRAGGVAYPPYYDAFGSNNPIRKPKNLALRSIRLPFAGTVASSVNRRQQSTFMAESVATLLVLVTGLVVLGVAWLVYLGTGGKPVRVTFEGFGIKVDIARPSVEERNLGEIKHE